MSIRRIRIIRTLLVILGMTLIDVPAALAAPSPTQEPLDVSYERYNGKTIRNINITVRDIFDDPGINAIYRTLNSLKVNTDEEVIRRELLLHEGEPFDDFRLKESIRSLRTLGFLRQVTITPKPDGDMVDLDVSVQDTWTLIPQVSFSSGTGNNRRAAGISESNLLGRGKRTEFAVEENDNRRSLQGVYEDERVMGTQMKLLAAHLERTDGQRTVAYFGRPYRSLIEKQSWNVSSDTFNLLGRLFQNGEARYVFRQRHTDAGGQFSLAHGEPKDSVGRYTLGFRYIEDRFSQATLKDYEELDINPDSVSHDPNLLAANRRFVGPTLGYTQIEPNYMSMNYIDRFDRVEDYNLGNEFSVNSMFAFNAMGSIEDTLLLNANNSMGYRFNAASFTRGEIGGATRLDSHGLANSLIRTQGQYYNVLGMLSAGGLNLGRHTLATGLRIDYGDKLDKDREFLLGADTGLRGYAARTFTGDKRLILNLEDRVHIADDVFRLVSVGCAFFIDAGGTTNSGIENTLGQDLYGDIGAGLRLAFPRSTGSRVLRVDIAFPMRSDPDGADAWSPRILFSGGQVFDSHLLSETEGPEKANVAVGFDQ
ncbi:MAG: BamA/TamA family outer membrane protein [Deltaproteobacteria bacterium]|nr:BamA/TamA family outer membrane protein [Deltaproteobacteria bacterium]